MSLLFCDVGDTAALWAAAQLQARGAPVDVVFADALGAATRWEHRITAGGATVDITLADGRELSSRDARPIFNRMAFVPVERLRAVAGEDFGYAVQEVFALYLSVLHAWPATVLNRPTPQGLSGAYRHPSVWRTLAARAGLPVRPWRQSSDAAFDATAAITAIADAAAATAFVVEDRVVLPEPLPPTLRDGCRALGRLAGGGLLGIDFACDGAGWALVGASATPNLYFGGQALIDALQGALA